MMKLTNEIKGIENFPTKINWKDLFSLEEPTSFYENIIFDINFYILIKPEMTSELISEISSKITEKNVLFASFSIVNEEYLSIFFENNCYLTRIKEVMNNSNLKEILFQLSQRRTFFISPIFDNYNKIKSIINELNHNNDKMHQKIEINNLIFPNENDQENIYYETQRIIDHINIKEAQNPIINFTKYSISAYVIRRFYYKTKYFQSTNNFYKTIKLQEFRNNEFISLRETTLNNILVFHKKTKQAFVQKICKERLVLSDFSKMKEMYEKINELQYFVKCFGFIKNQQNQIESLLFEYMSEGTLEDYLKKNKNLSNEQKMKISFQIIVELYLLHYNNIIYRDLKPDNIFVNCNYKIFIGDFDCSKFFSKQDTKTLTKDIGSFTYSSPEMLNSEEYTFSTDIYSYGLVLYYIFKGETPNKNDIFLNEKVIHFSDNFITNIVSKCLKKNPNERPTSENILDLFINLFIDQFKKRNSHLLLYLINYKIEIIQQRIISILYSNFHLRIKDNLYYLISILNENNNNKNDIFHKKSIKFLIKKSKENDSDAQCFLGLMYYVGEIILQDINKAIQYLTFSANQNNSNAQFYLGLIYFDDDFIQRDVNKSIHYFTLSANNNNSEAQYYLGLIFYKAAYMPRDINKSIHYFTLSANQNNSQAQLCLGLIYILNEFVPSDINKSIHYLTLSANQNNSYAQYYLGLIYIGDKFSIKNINKALNYFTLSANQNNSDAQLYLGIIYSNISNDIMKSIHYYTLAANQNNSHAQYLLGLIYYEAEFVQRDINKSIDYFTLAANQNYSDAQYFLGLIYYEAKFVPRNINKSIDYFILAANQNNIQAQLMLGLIYYESEYVPRDINKAIYYLTFSANNNNVKAQLYLGLIYYKLNIYESIYYFTLAAKQNNSFAQLFLGIIYSNKEDINKSIHYFTLSANQNNKYAQYYLGKLYLDNIFCKRDITKSIQYFTLSANQKYDKAQMILGYIFLFSNFVPKDFNKSFHYLTLSADQNNDAAQYYLGSIYYFAKYVSKDVNKAIHYLTLSANQNNDDSQFLLGFIYSQLKNKNKAIHYLTLSANQNNDYSQFLLGSIYIKNQYNINKGIYYLTLSSDNNNRISQYILGKIYLKGKLVSRDIDKAIHYLTLSSNNLYPISQLLLGEIYYFGKYSTRNIIKAIYYFKEASSLNNQYAKNNLGIIYKNGDEVEQNNENSKVYFNEAIQQNNNDFSLYNLARIYYFNEKNIEKSIELLEKSSKNDFFPSELFLFFIYFTENNYIWNLNTDKIYIKLKFQIGDKIRFIDNIFKNASFFSSQIFEFIENYDLMYSYENELNLFLSNLIKNIYHIDLFEKTPEKKDQRKNIDQYFYDGFYS